MCEQPPSSSKSANSFMGSQASDTLTLQCITRDAFLLSTMRSVLRARGWCQGRCSMLTLCWARHRQHHSMQAPFAASSATAAPSVSRQQAGDGAGARRAAQHPCCGLQKPAAGPLSCCARVELIFGMSGHLRRKLVSSVASPYRLCGDRPGPQGAAQCIAGCRV